MSQVGSMIPAAPSGPERLRKFFAVLQDELASLSLREATVVAARDRLASRMRKRAAFHDSSLDAEAITRFLENNLSVESCEPRIEPSILSNARHFITVALERYTANHVEGAIQCPLEVSLLYDYWRFGPGASNGIKGTHAAVKISQEMTVTARCVPFVRALRGNNLYFHCYDAVQGRRGYSEVNGSRLATVPKNEDTVRTIAIEPLGNMAMQLAAGTYLEGVLRYIGLDIRHQQPKNKLLARRGSIDDSIATIDLKAASDMISIDLVRLLMPESWTNLLLALRSPQIEIPGHGWVDLHMISTMGNGFTFPLMTLLLASLIYGVRASSKERHPNLRIDWSSTAVFGDDIIIPKDEYGRICEVLTQAGLVVNHDKSYSEGPFRESCGGDYWLGVDITPFYVKNLSSAAEVYVAINQVLEWGARFNICLFRTLTCLRSFLHTVHLVPEWMNPDQGVLSNRVPRRYKHLSIVQHQVKRSSDPFDMMLAVGGYVTPVGPDLFFVPRSNSTRYVVRKSRLPQGFRDGWDPCKRARLLSDTIASYIGLVF